jgi:hypothetical protein
MRTVKSLVVFFRENVSHAIAHLDAPLEHQIVGSLSEVVHLLVAELDAEASLLEERTHAHGLLVVALDREATSAARSLLAHAHELVQAMIALHERIIHRPGVVYAARLVCLLEILLGECLTNAVESSLEHEALVDLLDAVFFDRVMFANNLRYGQRFTPVQLLNLVDVNRCHLVTLGVYLILV